MANPQDHLSRWQSAGILDAATIARILEFERTAAPAPTTSDSGAGERPTVIEAVVYLGLVVIAAGVFFLAGNNWEDLESWAKIAICVVPTLATLALGAALRSNAQAALRRGGELAWFISVALFAVSLAVIMNELGDGDGDGRTLFLVTASATLAYASALWVFHPRDAQVAAVAGSAMLLLEALGNWPDDFSTELVGVCGFAVGALALFLGESGLFTPRRAVRVTFGLLAIASTYEASFESALGFEFLAFAAALGLLASGVARNSFTLVVLGIGGIFLALVTFVFAHFADSIGAPVALIISGGLVLLGVMLVAQARNITRTRTLMRSQGR